MGRREVDGRDGRRWVVRRRWAPRGADTLWAGIRRRFHWRRLEHGADALDPASLLDDFVAGAVLLLVAVVVIVFGVPLVLAIVDAVVVLALAAAGAVGRVVFRRPWTIEARSGDGVVRTWKVVGWRASRERRDEIAELLAAGISPPG